MKRRSLLGALVLASTLLGVAVACGPGFLDGLTDGEADGGTGRVLPDDDAGVCLTGLPPDAPVSGDLGSGPEIYFGLEQIKIDTQPPTTDGGLVPPRGLNLDHLCTCTTSGRACVPKNADGRADAGDPQCDGDAGRDDALGGLFNALLAGIQQASTDFATRKIQQGQFTIMVDLRNWNGTDNDPDVTVTLLGSQLLDRPDGGSPRPLFDGTDTWTLDPLSLYEGDTKLGKDCRIDTNFCNANAGRISTNGNAFVKDGVLVARFASAPFLIGTNVGDLMYDADSPTLFAAISHPEGGPVRLTGEIAGSWPTARALNAVSALTFPLDDGGLAPLCTEPDFYQLVRQTVCQLADLPADGGTAADQCETLSGSIAFTASTVQRPSFVTRRTDGGGPCATFQDDCLH